MLLSDRDIKKALADKKIVIKPLPDFKTQLGSCSIDLRLGNLFRVFDHSKYPFIDPYKKDAKYVMQNAPIESRIHEEKR